MYTCYRAVMLLAVMGFAGSISTPAWADDSDSVRSTDIPVTEIAILHWNGAGELIVEPTRIGIRLADAINDASTGHGDGDGDGDWDDDDDDNGGAGRWGGEWDSGYGSDDDDDEDDFKGPCGCHSTVTDPSFGLLAFLALGLTVAGRRRRTHNDD